MGLEHPSGDPGVVFCLFVFDPGVLKNPMLKVGLATGRSGASSWVQAFLPSCVRACQPVTLTDAWIPAVLALSHVAGGGVCVLVFLWPLHVQACLGLPSNCFGTRCVCGMGVSRLTISLITRGVCAHVLHTST